MPMRASVLLMLGTIICGTLSTSSAQLEFWYTNQHERIKLVVDESAKEIRVSRIVDGQFTGKVYRHRMDEFGALTNAFVRDGLCLEEVPEADPPEVLPSAPSTESQTQAPKVTRQSEQDSTVHADPEMTVAREFFGSSMAVLVVFGIYFFPTLIAGINRKRNGVAILILNLFLGWTLVGWVVALVWAACKDPGATETPK